MKKILMVALAGVLGMAGTAQAVVVDQFKCTWKVTKADGTAAVENVATLSSPRQSLSASPREGVFLTGGYARAQTRVEDGELTAHIELTYTHAVETKDGKIVRAAQSPVCLNLSLCSRDTPCFSMLCLESTIPGAQPWDPFEDINWQPVPLRGDVPLFGSPVASGRTSTRGGSLDVTCKHLTILD